MLDQQAPSFQHDNHFRHQRLTYLGALQPTRHSCYTCVLQAEKDALKDEGGPTKAVAREAQREADSLAQDLLEKCGGAKRDLGAIATDIENLRSRASALKPAQSFDLSQDWRLVFASDDDAICTVGTGLHKLPLTKMQVGQGYYAMSNRGNVCMPMAVLMTVGRVR